jgi:hypothetical protein
MLNDWRSRHRVSADPRHRANGGGAKAKPRSTTTWLQSKAPIVAEVTGIKLPTKHKIQPRTPDGRVDGGALPDPD